MHVSGLLMYIVLHASPYLHVATTIMQSQRIGFGQTRKASVTYAEMSAGQSDSRKGVCG